MRLTPDAKLGGAEKRRLAAAIKKAKRDGRLPQSAQQTIPYKEMCRDGICVVSDHYFTKQVQFYDINYQLAQNEDKNQIFENYCDFLNYFDSSIQVQLSFLNQRADMEERQRSISIPDQEDAFNGIREEYSDMLKDQLAKGNNGLTKTKYITFGIEAESLRAAKPRLERIEADILANFKALGVKAHGMDGYERLAVLHRMFHPADSQKFRFAWDAIWKTGLSSKDFIAPDSFTFRSGRRFQIGPTHGAVSFLQILAPELTDRMLADFLDLESSLVVTLHIQSIDQSAAIKNIKRKITDLDAMKIQEQKKAVRAGYDMELLPSDLVTFGAEAKTLLEDLQSRNERMFLVTLLVMNLADTVQKLENNIFQAAGIAQKYNCALRRLDYQQEQGLMSSLPLGQNQIHIQRGLTTSSTAIFVPFTTQELFMDGEALYYGLNALSNNLIMADRKKLKNPNGLILGTPGSGKSFSAKREIANAFLITQDDIAIIDPEDEYSTLVQRLGGQVVDISPTSSQYINPMDLNLNYSEDDNPLTLKSDFILSLMELIVGGKAGLEPVEKTVIDRCVHIIYREYLQDPRPEKMPVLGDLYTLMRKQPEPEAQRLATALEIYVTGSLNVFNHRTNVEIKSRIVCYVIKKLGKQLKKFGMQVVQDQVWGRVSENREAHKSTRLYIDEMHLLLREEQTAAYTVEIWKRFRKWGGIPTGITQNVKDLLASREIENIFENSDFIYILNQAGGDRQILAKQLNISPHQLSYVTNSNAGEGLLFYGNVIIPFVDHFPKDTELYSIMTTRPEDLAEQG
ncbi:VirB4-like conjugal transfer ATPase, CD1110 family [Agathobaculum sp. TL06]